MPHTLGQILPSLESLGLWSYWIIGLASMLEAYFATGVFVPGTLVVDAGGILVQQGVLDYFDLAWFVAIGSILGGELGYWTGIAARRGLSSRWRPEKSASYRKAERLFARHGGMALVIGRFLGPVSGLVPFAAAVAGMQRRRFAVWNVASGFPYALGHLAFGYFLGDVATRLGPMATRVALTVGALALGLAILWWLVARIERLLPFVLSVGGSMIRAVGENPDVRDWAGRHPGLARFIAGRFDTSRFGGLSATLFALTFAYLFAVWVGTVLDFLMTQSVVQLDMHLVGVIHDSWNPLLLRLSAYITALGDSRVVALLVGAALIWLAGRRRPDLMLGLAVAVAGDVASVTLLKRIFDRPRPDPGYFIETSGSFPSGHAAISVAFYGMLFFIAWRRRVFGPLSAAVLAATLAFLIGLSRLYLIEHYLSDVLNGWLVGGMWLLIGMAVAEWWRESRGDGGPPVGSPMRELGFGLMLVLIVAAGWFVVRHDRPLRDPGAVQASARGTG